MRLHRRAKIGHSFLATFLIQADFQIIGALRRKLSLLLLSEISNLDICLAHRAFSLNLAFGRYIDTTICALTRSRQVNEACVQRSLWTRY